MDNYVQKEAGKVLSSNDFTGELKLKLESLSNYDDSEVKGRLADLENAADTHLCEIPIVCIFLKLRLAILRLLKKLWNLERN